MLAALSASALCLAAAGAPGAHALPPNEQCRPLPALPGHRLPLHEGERLEYDVDFLGGVKVGTVTLQVLPPEHQGNAVTLPISVRALSNQFFSKFGKVDSSAVSHLKPRDLHPVHFREDFLGPKGKYWTDVAFPSTGPHVVRTRFGNADGKVGESTFPYGNDALDVVGAFYLLRSLDLKEGEKLCFDVYASRTLWRLWGKVEAREAISTEAGNFETWRLSGEAARLNAPNVRRQVHFWISDDARRLPVAAVGDLDIGPMRALLREVGTAKPVAHVP